MIKQNEMIESKQSEKNYKIIRVRLETHSRLDKLHLYRRESFDEIINRLCDLLDSMSGLILPERLTPVPCTGNVNPCPSNDVSECSFDCDNVLVPDNVQN